MAYRFAESWNVQFIKLLNDCIYLCHIYLVFSVAIETKKLVIFLVLESEFDNYGTRDGLHKVRLHRSKAKANIECTVQVQKCLFLRTLSFSVN